MNLLDLRSWFVVVVFFGSVPLGRAIDYPGLLVGPAKAAISPQGATMQNESISMEWEFGDGHLRPVGIKCKVNSESLSMKERECFSVTLGQTPDPRVRTLRASELKLAAPPELKRLQANPVASRLGDRFDGWELSARLVSSGPNLQALWRAVLRDGANYIRQEVVFRTQQDFVEVVDVVLLEFRVGRVMVAGRVEGSPIVSDAMFFGLEHPASRSEVTKGDALRCSYPYNNAVSPTDTLTLSSVVGVFPPGQQRRGFLHYLERERARPFTPHLHHNNGEDIGMVYYNFKGDPRMAATGAENDAMAADFRSSQEQRWRDLIETVGTELVSKRGAVLDAFVHDYGWDEESLVWQFHNGFPNGFRSLLGNAKKYGAHLGIWFSPWGGYPDRIPRVKAGRGLGFETNQQKTFGFEGGLSLAGARYYARYRAACINLLRHHGVKYFKFDGFAGFNNPPGAGEYRSDVEALWRLLSEMRLADPEIFINTSSGTWASPFWLLRADSIWRGGGDTGIAGAKGSSRQQWITYRDYEVHNRVLVNGPLYPISSLMTHGIMINGGGRVKSFDEHDIVDEIRSFFASGVNAQELYITPGRMTSRAWDVLAERSKWSRANADVLADTHWVGGDPAKGKVYGWAGWSQRKGILSLRNPSDQPATFSLDIGEAFELPTGATRTYSLKSSWDDTDRLSPIILTAGAPYSFELKPFEVLTLDAMPVTPQ